MYTIYIYICIYIYIYVWMSFGDASNKHVTHSSGRGGVGDVKSFVLAQQGRVDSIFTSNLESSSGFPISPLGDYFLVYIKPKRILKHIIFMKALRGV